MFAGARVTSSRTSRFPVVAVLASRLLLVLVVFALVSGAVARAATVPPGFNDQKVASVDGVTDITFTADGRMLVMSAPGIMSIRLPDGTLLNAKALDMTSKVCATQDRGFQSVAVDPSFATNHYIYIYYTSNKNGTCNDYTYPNGPVNRLSRFVLADNNTVDPLSEAVLVDNIPSMYLHQGGDTAFGKDGDLYVTVGDGGCYYLDASACFSSNGAARDTNTLLGKVLRLTAPDGGIPTDNPYTGPNSARCNVTGSTSPGNFCQETYAWGLRNPWRVAFDPNASGTRFFINDVGQSTWEEIDLGQSGSDYGWNVREGPCRTDSRTNCGSPPAGMTNPIYYYDHATGCTAITGGAFVPIGAWRAEDDGAYLYADFTCGKIFELRPSGGGGALTASEFLTGAGSNTLVAMTFGPFAGGQALYYSSWPTAEIRRVSFGNYPVPKGATPTRVSLVPAYTPCTGPNRTHGAPLSYGSCTPPAQASGFVTVGTPDANGQLSNSRGFARFDVYAGDPATPANEADVGITARSSDVRSKSNFSDYTGELQADYLLRITDRDNRETPTSATSPGTVQDTPFPITMPCVATSDVTIGSTCSVSTSMNALMPSAVVEGNRAIWELGEVKVYDGGPDGLASTTTGNTLFETQGVFVP